MRLRRAAYGFAAFGALLWADAALAQRMTLAIEIRGTNSSPAHPAAPVNNLQELSAALAACWSPPPPDRERGPVDVIFQVSFKRSGELFGKPRIVEFARPVTAEERGRFEKFRNGFKEGRPRAGEGATLVTVSIERGKAERIEAFIKRHGIGRRFS